MNFIADKQTLDDLGILNKYRPDSVFTLFNQTKTSGGKKLLEEMFRNLLADEKEINLRSSIFNYFQKQALDFPFNKEQLELMESYLGAGVKRSFPATLLDIFRKKLISSFVGDKSYAAVKSGIYTTIEILSLLKQFLGKMDVQDMENPYARPLKEMKSILGNEKLESICREVGLKKDSVVALAKCDHLLRSVLFAEIRTLVTTIYQLDVYIAVSNVASAKCFSYASAVSRTSRIFQASDLRHPCLKSAVGNTVSLSEKSNLIFLTGANMAGKSTIMKSFGIAVYLAHMGFPVAAKEMLFSVKDGLYSSINVPDNLQLGYSHFYAEVLRVRDVAVSVAGKKDLIIIFDELFKGTNVKDAYDATLAVTKAFSEYRNCFFIISTHIVEVGEALQQECGNMQFLYMPTVMEGSIPRYTYRITKGISADRHGMTIIKNEGILDMILSKKPTVLSS
ncbi:MAG: DNA mismatch repair protein [Bacteroidota bacterium]